jgi:hypothetical protein
MASVPQYTPITTSAFRDAYNAVWTMLEANTDFQGWFPNQVQKIKLNEQWAFTPNPDPDNRAPADYPAVRIAWVELDTNLERDSTGSQPTWTLEIQLWTGAQQQGLLLDCVWPIVRAFTTWRKYVRDVVQWQGQLCVTDVDPKNQKITNPDLENEPLKARGTDQWIGVWRFSIDFNFRTLDLQSL